MKFPASFVSRSEEDTSKLASDFADELKDGMVIVFNGDLGTGKTFFIRQMLKKYNINTVNSPTFAIVNEYTGIKKFYHFDFYRINKISELMEIGITEYFKDNNAIVLIEWGSLFEQIIPQKRIEITLTYNQDNSRLFNFINYD